MPIYSYRCKKCSNQFELLVGVIADSKELKCTKCQSKDIEKQLATFAVNKKSSSGPTCSTGTCPTCY